MASTETDLPNTPVTEPRHQSAHDVTVSSEVDPKTERAATVIQRAWRRHIDIQVYRYYRDLINFKEKGDPALMLRCINPIEAKMLDAAAGVHVRFRLGGDRFPPNIYYKIFTHRPVQDLCSNSPKDYTAASCKKQDIRTLHNRLDGAEQNVRDGWYERRENNGWRLVSDKVTNPTADHIMWNSSRKKQEFHHNKLQRKSDIDRKRKEKKIDWMKKMYREGMLQAREADERTTALIEGAARGMVLTVEAEGQDAVQDWEVDELLEWTTGLNFDEYQSGWKTMATSATSENVVDSKSKAYREVGPEEPFELPSTAGLAARGPGGSGVSHNTPIHTLVRS